MGRTGCKPELPVLYETCHSISSFYHVTFYMEANLFSREIGASLFKQLLSPVGFGLYELVLLKLFFSEQRCNVSVMHWFHLWICNLLVPSAFEGRKGLFCVEPHRLGQLGNAEDVVWGLLRKLSGAIKLMSNIFSQSYVNSLSAACGQLLYQTAALSRMSACSGPHQIPKKAIPIFLA